MFIDRRPSIHGQRYYIVGIILVWAIVMTITGRKLKEERFINGHLISAAVLFPAIYWWKETADGFEKLGWFIFLICFLLTSLIMGIAGEFNKIADDTKEHTDR
jgi:hypothetical protein